MVDGSGNMEHELHNRNTINSADTQGLQENKPSDESKGGEWLDLNAFFTTYN